MKGAPFGPHNLAVRDRESSRPSSARASASGPSRARPGAGAARAGAGGRAGPAGVGLRIPCVVSPVPPPARRVLLRHDLVHVQELRDVGAVPRERAVHVDDEIRAGAFEAPRVAGSVDDRLTRLRDGRATRALGARGGGIGLGVPRVVRPAPPPAGGVLLRHDLVHVRELGDVSAVPRERAVHVDDEIGAGALESPSIARRIDDRLTGLRDRGAGGALTGARRSRGGRLLFVRCRAANPELHDSKEQHETARPEGLHPIHVASCPSAPYASDAPGAGLPRLCEKTPSALARGWPGCSALAQLAQRTFTSRSTRLRSVASSAPSSLTLVASIAHFQVRPTCARARRC